MIIIKGNNSRKIDTVWDLVKKKHSGNKVAVVSYKGAIPHGFVRIKQMHAYETLTQKNILQDLKQFLQAIGDQFEAIVLYINCDHQMVDAIKEIAADFRQPIFLTVHDSDTILAIEEH